MTYRLPHRFPIKVLLLLIHVALTQLFALSETKLEIRQIPGTDLIRFTPSKAGQHALEIDDAYGFVTPVVARKFATRKLDLHANDVGLIPGIDYHVRLDGGREIQDLRLAHSVFSEPQLNCGTLRRTWEVTGRFSTGTALSGLRWVGDHWVIAPHTYLLGESLYNVELLLRPALAAARACGDLRTLDEIAQYYIIMLQQTETVRDLLKRQSVTQETRARLKSTDPAARTFSASFGDQVGEGELYNSQWLHPAALLVRVISLLPETSRTSAMNSFAAQYTPFLIKDQLERYLFRQQMPPPGEGKAGGRVGRWEAAMRGLKGRDPWDNAMSDIDLWFLASTAEMLGAHANDAQLVPIESTDLALLNSAMATGIRFFQSTGASYPDTKNFNGEVVGSTCYFNGEYATDSDMAFSAVGGEKFPSASQRRALANVSWDTSHIYRLPIFLRALYENRKAIRSGFPQYKDLQLVANQYVYKVFNGDYSRPLFHNYFDGSDGWFRVAYNGSDFGHPPSEFCDMHNPKRPCLIPGAIIAWGELAFVNADLIRLEQSLVQLAFNNNPATVEFRDRHYFFGSPYKVNVVDGFDVYGGALYFTVAENAEMLPDSR